MDDKRQGARRRFDRALAAHGEAALTDQLVAWVEKTFGQPLEELGDEEFDEAVETVAERRAEAPIFGGAKKRRAAPSGPRAEQPPAESALAGSEWHAYLEGHVERVLASFAWLRDDARLRLGLRPLTPGAPSTYRVAMAWLTGDERFLDVDDDDGELALLGDREAAQLWLVGYIIGQGGSGGSEVLLWRGSMGEDVAMPFPASCHPLRNLRDLARRVVEATGCREVEAAEWLLADMRPQLPPVLLVTSYPSLVEVAREPDGEPEPAYLPHVSRRYVITVSSGLISPDEVAALYRRARNHDYGLPTEPSARQTVWSAELVRFVARERRQGAPGARLASWGQLLARWNELYQQHRYVNERAMRSSYQQATSRVLSRDEGKGTEP